MPAKPQRSPHKAATAGRGEQIEMKRVMKIAEELPVGREMELTDDIASYKSFWCNLLDYASAERIEAIDFCPANRDDCITVSTGDSSYPMIPLPYDVQDAYLRYAQRVSLGRLLYIALVVLNKKDFVREPSHPLTIQIGDRLSKWDVTCRRDSIRFVRHPRNSHAQVI